MNSLSLQRTRTQKFQETKYFQQTAKSLLNHYQKARTMNLTSMITAVCNRYSCKTFKMKKARQLFHQAMHVMEGNKKFSKIPKIFRMNPRQMIMRTKRLLLKIKSKLTTFKKSTIISRKTACGQEQKLS